MKEMTKEKFELMFERIERIDIAIQGDESRGLKGLADHMADFGRRMDDHEGLDNRRIQELSNQLEDILLYQTKQKWFVSLGKWLIGALVTLLSFAWLIDFVKWIMKFVKVY